MHYSIITLFTSEGEKKASLVYTGVLKCLEVVEMFLLAHTACSL